MNLPGRTSMWSVAGGAVAALTLALLLPLQGQTVFSTDFEAPDYSPGTLVSDPDWSFDSSELDVQVIDLDAASGLQSLSLTGASPFEYASDPLVALPQVLWLDFSLKPVFTDLPESSLSFDAGRTAVTGFVKVNTTGEVYAVDGDGQGSGQWTATGSTATLSGDQSQDWLRLTYRLDYSTKTWDLFVDGELIAVDLGFLNTDAARFETFTLRGDEAQASGLDNFSVEQANPLYVDVDNDGLDDAYETAQGLNTAVNDRDQDADNDTLSNLTEYLSGLSAGNADSDGDGVHDGAEILAGADPLVADAYSLSSLPFAEDFEAAAPGDYTAAAWTITGTSPQVQADDAVSGVQALALSADTRMRAATDGSGTSVVWIDVYLRPELLASAPTPAAEAAHGFYFNTDGQALALDGTGNGSGLWQLLDVATRDDWRRVTAKLDYTSQSYDLYIDGGRVASGLGFAQVQPYLTGLNVSGAEIRHLDDLSAGEAEPAGLDNDRDGWDNATELIAATDPERFDTDGDGLADSLDSLWAYDPLSADTGLAQLTETAPESGIFSWNTSFAAAEGYTEGALNGQQDWFAQGSVTVVAEQVDVTDSTTGEASFERYAGLGETRRLWISFRAKLLTGQLPDVATLAEPAVAIWGFVGANQLRIWNQTTQEWQAFETTADATEWNDYDLYFDYVQQEWMLVMNGRLVASELPFVDEDLIVFSRFKALQVQQTEEHGADEEPATASFDDFAFSTAEPAGLDFDGDGVDNATERALGSDLFSADTDGDGLGDAYENANGLDVLANDVSGDLDGDGLTNQQEFDLGLDPQVQDAYGADGIVRRDLWTGIGGGRSVSNLTNHPRFPVAPNRSDWVVDLNFPERENAGNNYGQRIYGMIIAPETAEYTFWIAGDNEHELWLSTDESPSNRELIAYGRSATLHQQWFGGTRQSDRTLLQAGQAYYFEILHKERRGSDHVSVAWQYGNQARQIITAEHLRGPNAPTPDDLDQDGLPDAWEIANGLDAAAGYGVNGYAGDLDRDGLPNYRESQLGTRADLSDTDGDGFSDAEELTELYSDPTLADLSAIPTVVSTVDGAAFSSTRGAWATEAGELYSIDSTGAVGYTLDFPEAGAYRIVVQVTEQNPFRNGDSRFDLRGSLNGVNYGVRTASVAFGESAEITYYLPYLPGDNYTFNLTWLNGFGNSFLRIRSLRIERIEGADLNENGIPDWVENRTAQNGSEAALPLEIYTSPFAFEGTSFAPAAVALSSHPVSDSASLREETVTQALSNSYYANIELLADEDRVVLVNDQSGLRTSQHTLTWAAFNAVIHDFYHIRLDDSMLLTAIDDTLPQARPVELRLTAPDGTVETHSLAAEARLQARFDQTGDWQLQATLLPPAGEADEDPLVYDSVIRVSSASLAPAPVILAGRSRIWTPDISDTDVVVEVDNGLSLHEPNPAALPRRFELASSSSGRVIARLPNGPILSSTEARVIRDFSNTQTSNQVVETFADGTVLVRAFILLNEVPEDLLLHIVTIRSGVVFDDGTVSRTVTSADFDEQGRYQFFLLRAPGVDGGNCHRYLLWQDGHAL